VERGLQLHLQASRLAAVSAWTWDTTKDKTGVVAALLDGATGGAGQPMEKRWEMEKMILEDFY
jgi:hypothetical protein